MVSIEMCDAYACVVLVCLCMCKFTIEHKPPESVFII